MNGPRLRQTSIPGLLLVDLVLHRDGRGWFKEAFQRAKLEALGFPKFEIVQSNVSYNAEVGVTRGIHAEPWDKFISLAHGRAFAAIGDLRAGGSFGRVETFELHPGNAIFVPRGCGNSYQTLTPDVVYSYLVNEHWSPDSRYTLVQAFDPGLGIDWPIGEDKAIRSAKDRGHPPLAAVAPMEGVMRVLVLGAGGQVGRAVAAALPDATALGHADLDIADAASATIDWSAYDTVVNAAAYTDVDGAETAEGRVAAWRANAAGPAALAAICRKRGATLVHLSTEYVFDGRAAQPYREDDPVAPLSAYGASKAAGDLAAQTVERHYLVRPTWVVGDGRNFVRTMLGLAGKGVEPAVVADQIGRPTFASDIAAAIVQLVAGEAPYGSYHVTGGGDPASWADVARATYALAGHGDLRVTDTTAAEYFAGKPHAAPRPRNSVLDLSRAAEAGVPLPDWRVRLAEYVRAATGS